MAKQGPPPSLNGDFLPALEPGSKKAGDRCMEAKNQVPECSVVPCLLAVPSRGVKEAWSGGASETLVHTAKAHLQPVQRSHPNGVNGLDGKQTVSRQDSQMRCTTHKSLFAVCKLGPLKIVCHPSYRFCPGKAPR
ncbi:uncharacterized protein CIMG_03119 [Coccidioides immitis RS]|uniref:Uncharacterized protein n=2 Tax=Coccidioides immitis TaxID=5501 RepID=J3KAN5_COCIM|nr:uncharacterized protein CIMG_03119 [Coccidioides immitis RS]EAS32095.3 hypothetical protein CIMG_03119 [Coccidioides immitis RS]KMP07290.1 hypothetical protein CIRG_06971 [Coccidioides immitis RMSCC 2394]